MASSDYLGVSWHKASRKWAAQVRNGKEIEYLGLFDSERKAAKAYDDRARALGHGKLNWVDPNDCPIR